MVQHKRDRERERERDGKKRSVRAAKRVCEVN